MTYTKKTISFLLALVLIIMNFNYANAELSTEDIKKLDSSVSLFISKSLTWNSNEEKIANLKVYITQLEEAYKTKTDPLAKEWALYMKTKIQDKINEIERQSIVITDKLTYKNVCDGSKVQSSFLQKDDKNIANSFFKELKKTDSQKFYSYSGPVKFDKNFYFFVSTNEYNLDRIKVIKLSCADYMFNVVDQIDIKELWASYNFIWTQDDVSYLTVNTKTKINYSFDFSKLKFATIKNIPIKNDTINTNTWTTTNNNSWTWSITKPITNTWAISNINSAWTMSSLLLSSISTTKIDKYYNIKGKFVPWLKINFVEFAACTNGSKNWFRLTRFKKGDSEFNIYTDLLSKNCKIPHKIRFIWDDWVFEMNYKAN